MRYIIFDYETTGINIESDLPIQYGLLADSWEKPITKLINQAVDIPESATAIHGITTDQIRMDGISPENAAAELLAYFQAFERIIVHNGLRFDVPIFEKQCGLYGLQPPDRSKYIDTAGMYKGLRLGKIAKPGQSHFDYCIEALDSRVVGLKFNVKFIVEEFKIDADKTFHDAGGDVYYTREIFRVLADYSNIKRKT